MTNVLFSNLMKGIEPRFYRRQMGEGRLHSFVIGYKDSDLWIGIDPESYFPEIAEFAQNKLTELRKELEAYLLVHTNFASSFSPVRPNKNAPEIAHYMAEASQEAQTGPMAAVAGAFSEFIGKAIQNNYSVNEIVVENGGDIYLSLKNNLTISVYAGTSPLSEKIGIEIPAYDTPLGICTSAGTVGPSTSFGIADAVMVVSKKTALADAFATAIGNQIKGADSISHQLSICEIQPDILSIIIICDGQIGIKGKYELKLF